MMNFDPLTPEITWLMFTCSMSTAHSDYAMPMHLTSGHVTLLLGEFLPPPQLDLWRRLDSHCALHQISSFIVFFIVLHLIVDWSAPLYSHIIIVVKTSFISLINSCLQCSNWIRHNDITEAALTSLVRLWGHYVTIDVICYFVLIVCLPDFKPSLAVNIISE